MDIPSKRMARSIKDPHSQYALISLSLDPNKGNAHPSSGTVSKSMNFTLIFRTWLISRNCAMGRHWILPQQVVMMLPMRSRLLSLTAILEAKMLTSKPRRILMTNGQSITWSQCLELSATGDCKSNDRNEAKHLEHTRDTFGGKSLEFSYVYSAVCGDGMIHIGERSTIDSRDKILSAPTDELRSDVY
ncbi:hypothetical protein DL89DRAFT_269750 [Linderina pennispora]|uniref:Uncharacterized protein n=1 Tax=Linderina pennispora TaxID=61395 RepID=A0A1Y1W085_9FUNG|nr:uncharacterized protein DL89DRAFT_269750 [Linderina pennispora]ORX66695.1 hypothetical protein DL89DRAFT_269750 [Linderina pennispora]